MNLSKISAKKQIALNYKMLVFYNFNYKVIGYSNIANILSKNQSLD